MNTKTENLFEIENRKIVLNFKTGKNRLELKFVLKKWVLPDLLLEIFTGEQIH